MEYRPLVKIVARVALERPEKCEIEHFATGRLCGKPAEVVWVCGVMRKLVCKRCSFAITVCGGMLEELPPPSL